MNEDINKFLIVRKANSMELVKPYNKLFIIEDKMYQGIDRACFYDLYEDYFNKILPKQVS